MIDFWELKYRLRMHLTMLLLRGIRTLNKGKSRALAALFYDVGDRYHPRVMRHEQVPESEQTIGELK